MSQSSLESSRSHEVPRESWSQLFALFALFALLRVAQQVRLAARRVFCAQARCNTQVMTTTPCAEFTHSAKSVCKILVINKLMYNNWNRVWINGLFLFFGLRSISQYGYRSTLDEFFFSDFNYLLIMKFKNTTLFTKAKVIRHWNIYNCLRSDAEKNQQETRLSLFYK